jgi:VTC domain
MLQAAHSRETRDRAREIKFLVTSDTANQILDWARPRLGPDPYAGGESGDEYLTTTIYFDTNDFAVYRRQGSYRRSKYRVRRYGQADVTFLERKLRTATLLSKRRTVVSLAELHQLALPVRDPKWPGFWFAERLAARRLAPVCQVAYHRHARVGTGPFGPMRLTFDTEIAAQPSHAITFDPPNGVPVLTADTIVEMKFCLNMPPVFKDLVNEFGLSPTAISKYRLSLEALRTAGLRTGAARTDLQTVLAALNPGVTGTTNA